MSVTRLWSPLVCLLALPWFLSPIVASLFIAISNRFSELTPSRSLAHSHSIHKHFIRPNIIARSGTSLQRFPSHHPHHHILRVRSSTAYACIAKESLLLLLAASANCSGIATLAKHT